MRIRMLLVSRTIVSYVKPTFEESKNSHYTRQQKVTGRPECRLTNHREMSYTVKKFCLMLLTLQYDRDVVGLTSQRMNQAR